MHTIVQYCAGTIVQMTYNRFLSTKFLDSWYTSLSVPIFFCSSMFLRKHERILFKVEFNFSLNIAINAERGA